MSKYNLVNIRKNSIDEKNSIKNSVGYKNRLTIRYREPFNLIARNRLNDFWCPRQDLNLHLGTRLAPEASASASFATRACTDYSTPHGLRDIYRTLSHRLFHKMKEL